MLAEAFFLWSLVIPPFGHLGFVIWNFLPAMPDLRCPVCDRPIDPDKPAALPFCSDRCKQIDLGRWLGERYGLPFESPHEFDDGGMDDEAAP
jgi:uncharacterized protein